MTTAMDPKDILIRTLSTPNPYAMKFVINASFKDEGKASFNTQEEARELPLVRDLFAIDGVKQVHLFQNTLTVTHSGELSTEAVSGQVESVIRTRYPLHNPAFGEAAPKPKVRPESVDPVVTAIEEILDRTIRPGLQADGGDIEIVSFENDELKIMYQGACGGCPSSMAGTLDAIQGILRNELGNEKISVIPL
jgi:NFU1 iron-sulfur cluster scaffold homolog, mitochondrial